VAYNPPEKQKQTVAVLLVFVPTPLTSETPLAFHEVKE
jgi:hypothetical protein